jgi:hypothetical protein
MTLRLGMIACCLLLVGNTPCAAPSPPVKPDPDAWVKRKVDALVRAARAAFDTDDPPPAYVKALNSMAAAIRRRTLAGDEDFARRYRELVAYVQTIALDQQPGHELGFAVPDKQYFDETRQYVQVPEFLMDQRFLRAVSRYETLAQAKSFLRRLNATRAPADQLIFFSYTSQHLGTPDNDDSYQRLLIVVPGDAASRRPEQWVQFGVTDPRVRPRTRNVSVITAAAGSDGAFDTYFKDYFRTYHRDGSISIKGRWELGYGDDNCARCHKSGILPIFPEAGSVSPDEQPMVEAVNRRFLTHGPPRFGKYLDASKLGPGLGSASWESRRQRFGAGFGETAVGQAMNCTTCHGYEGLGAFSWPMDQATISSYIKGGQMPLGRKLTDSERDELYEKLVQEYFATSDSNPGILKSWLLGRLR